MREVHLAGSHLAIEMRQAQIELGLSPIAGHGVLVALDDAQSRISDALGMAARGHAKLRTLAMAIGIDPRGYGERTDPEDDQEARRAVGRDGPATVA